MCTNEIGSYLWWQAGRHSTPVTSDHGSIDTSWSPGARPPGPPVYYYTAYANHTNSTKVSRHRRFVTAIEDSGVSTVLGRFKRKTLQCRASCREEFESYEEKETDVNLAISIVEDAVLGHYDSVVLVSGDTDLLPALRVARSHGKGVYALFPPGRKNDDIARLCDGYARIKVSHLEKYLLPDPVTLTDGRRWCMAPVVGAWFGVVDRFLVGGSGVRRP